MITEKMHPADIRAALQKRGISQKQLAKQLNVSETAISLVINGTSTSYRVASAISDEIGVSLEKIWPGRYPVSDYAA